MASTRHLILSGLLAVALAPALRARNLWAISPELEVEQQGGSWVARNPQTGEENRGVVSDVRRIAAAAGSQLSRRGFANPDHEDLVLITNVQPLVNAVRFDAVIPAPSGDGHGLIRGLGGGTIPFPAPLEPHRATDQQIYELTIERALIRYGNILIAHVTDAEGKPKSRVYDLDGQPASAEMARIYETRLVESGRAEFATQIGRLEDAGGPFPLLLHPFDEQGEALALPEGAAGMVPLAQSGEVFWTWHPHLPVVPGRHAGWAIVYPREDGLDYALGLGTAADVIARADRLRRWRGVRFFFPDPQKPGSRHWIALRDPDDGLWRLADPRTLATTGAPAETPELARAAADPAFAARANPWAAALASASGNRAAVAQRQQAAVREAEESRQEIARARADPLYGKQVFYNQIRRISDDPDTILSAAAALGCTKFLEDMRQFPPTRSGMIWRARDCGASEEFLKTYGGKAYGFFERASARAEAREASQRAMAQWMERLNSPYVDVVTFGVGGMKKITVTREEYIYGRRRR